MARQRPRAAPPMARLRLRLLAVAALAAVSHASAPASDDGYDRKEGEIMQHAKAAAQLHNSGRVKEAYAALDKAEESFRAAAAIRPKDPQAFITIATTMLNSQRFDSAIKYWKQAASLVPEGHLREWIRGRERWSAYGKVSTKRDRVYSQGQGNLTQAMALVKKQLKLYPDMPTLRHDKATMHMMRSAHNSSEVGEALAELDLAHAAALAAWRAGVRQRGGTCCETCGGIVHDWPSHLRRGGALVSVDPLPGGGERYGDGAPFIDGAPYVAKFEDVAIAGDDGVILDEAGCWMFLPSSGRWSHPANNLQLLEIWGGPQAPTNQGPYHAWHDHHRGRFDKAGQVAKPPKLAKVASVVQFAATAYFHFMTEVLGRLQVLRKHGVFDDAEVRLLAPQSAGKKSKDDFIAHAMAMLAPDLAERVVWVKAGGRPDVRLRAGVLYYANWPLPMPLGADGSHSPTPRSVLRLVQASLLQGSAAGDAAAAPPPARRLLFISRAGKAMRGALADEAALQKAAKNAAAGAEPPLEFQVFKGGGSLAQQISRFREARVVVGVHGGALTNLLFCAEGALAFEVGFASPVAGHYRHLAAALGVRLVLLPLRADERGMGANEVRLESAASSVAAIRDALRPDGRGGAGAAEL